MKMDEDLNSGPPGQRSQLPHSRPGTRAGESGQATFRAVDQTHIDSVDQSHRFKDPAWFTRLTHRFH